MEALVVFSSCLPVRNKGENGRTNRSGPARRCQVDTAIMGIGVQGPASKVCVNDGGCTGAFEEQWQGEPR